MPIDLRPYGIDWSIGPELIPEYGKISSAELLADYKLNITLPSSKIVSFTLVNYLGGGTFGKVYSLKEQIENSPAVIKVIIKEHQQQKGKIITKYENFMKETINQIIVCETTKDITFPEINLTGPFAPKVFYVAEDKTAYYIVSEQMSQTLEEYFVTPDINFAKLKSSFVQISKIHQVLQEKLNFNHRDFKLDNVMCRIGSNGLPIIKFIDFGFSCLQYDKMKINTETLMKTCSNKARDLGSLFFLLNMTYDYYVKSGRMTQRKTPFRKYEQFYRIIKALIESDSSEKPKNWASSYAVLNRRKDVPNLHPDVVFNVFNSLELENASIEYGNLKPNWVTNLLEINTINIDQLTTDELSLVTSEQINNQSLDNLKVMFSKVLSNKISRSFINLILEKHPDLINIPNSLAETPLIVALKENNIELVDLLLKHPKLDTNITDNDLNNILHLLFKSTVYRKDFLDYIIKKNPDLINKLNKEGYTPLMVAIVEHQEEATQILLTTPTAILDIKDKSNNNLLNLLIMSNQYRKEHLDLLLEKYPEMINNKTPFNKPRRTYGVCLNSYVDSRITSRHQAAKEKIK
jgi:serine/threonine protein kinase